MHLDLCDLYIFILFRSTRRVDGYECLFITILKISKYCFTVNIADANCLANELAGAKLRTFFRYKVQISLFSHLDRFHLREKERM